jgi:hypothetical protein
LGGLEAKTKEDYAPFGRVILFGLQPKEKALQRCRAATGFSFVAESVEISNLNLIRDMVCILKLEETLSMIM